MHKADHRLTAFALAAIYTLFACAGHGLHALTHHLGSECGHFGTDCSSCATECGSASQTYCSHTSECDATECDAAGCHAACCQSHDCHAQQVSVEQKSSTQQIAACGCHQSGCIFSAGESSEQKVAAVEIPQADFDRQGHDPHSCSICKLLAQLKTAQAGYVLEPFFTEIISETRRVDASFAFSAIPRSYDARGPPSFRLV